MIAFTYSQPQIIPGEIPDCFVRFVRVTALDVPAGAVSRITSLGPLYCVPGVAAVAICVFTRGRLPSATFITCTVECAETWICSAFPASMARGCSRGCFACFVCPRTGARLAETAFSPSGFTVELSRSIAPLIHIRKRIPSRIRVFHTRHSRTGLD